MHDVQDTDVLQLNLAELPRLELDCSDYKDEIKALKLDEEEAAQFLQAMWNAMRLIVEMGLDLRQFPVVGEEVANITGQEAENLLERKSIVFNEASVPRKESS